MLRKYLKYCKCPAFAVLYIQGFGSWNFLCKREINVKAVNIKLSLAENVKSFVNIASRYPYDIDLRVGRHVVDGKSILGIFSLDLSKPITLEVYADNCDDLMEEIQPFVIG